jgi:hypothetical protein
MCEAVLLLLLYAFTAPTGIALTLTLLIPVIIDYGRQGWPTSTHKWEPHNSLRTPLRAALVYTYFEKWWGGRWTEFTRKLKYG